MNVVAQQSGSVLIDMASRYGMNVDAFELTVRATCSPKGKDARPLTREEFAAFLLVAREHRLNPLLREIYAFPAKGGGIVPVVGIDGWVNLVNSHPAFDGLEFSEDHTDKGGLLSIECTIWRKDRQRPTKVREHLAECYRQTDAWNMPHRMLRHKALIQTARYAFGFAGIYDEEEAAVIANSRDTSDVGRKPPLAPKMVEHIDRTTGEITEVQDTSAAAPQTVAGRKRGAAAAKSPPSTDVPHGEGLDSPGAVRHEGSRTTAIPSGSPTVDRKAEEAHTGLIRDLAHAQDMEELEATRDGYMTQWGMAWSREQKEEAAEAYGIACDRIERTKPVDEYTMGDRPASGIGEVPKREDNDDFPGDTPAAENTAPPAAEKVKKARKPPKAPEPVQEPATDEEPTTAHGYRNQFMARYNAVETVEQAKALKSWWFQTGPLRNACGCTDHEKEELRNLWTSRLLELQGQA